MFARIQKKRNLKHDGKTSFSYAFSLLCIIFVFGVLIGSFYFKLYSNSDEVIAIDNALKGGQIASFEEFCSGSFQRKIVILVLLWILGLSIIGLPILYLFLLLEGFSVGVIISVFLHIYGILKGSFVALIMLYFPILLSTFAYFYIALRATKTAIDILKDKSSMKEEIIRFSVSSFISLFLLIISAFSSLFFCRIGWKILP